MKSAVTYEKGSLEKYGCHVQWYITFHATQWFYFKYKKRLLPRCIHHFKSDLIYIMDHMRISGNEPSSVILSQKCIFKNWTDVPNVPKTSWCQQGWCNKPTKLQFGTILTRKILMFSNATNQPKSTVELGYMCPRGLSGPPAVTLTK